MRKAKSTDLTDSATPEQSVLPAGYDDLLRDIKARVQAALVRAAVAVNQELVLLYLGIVRDISQKISQLGWGSKVVDQLTHDLRSEFPKMTGLSDRNLKYMRAFAEVWPDELILQEVLAKLTWYHNIALIEKSPSSEMRLTTWCAILTMHRQLALYFAAKTGKAFQNTRCAT